MHPYLASGVATVLAHRGASAEVPPGNSLAAFQHAIDLGADHIETDVQASADGRIVVFHDEYLDDATSGSGRIADHTWEELRGLRLVADGVPTGEGLVLLEDVLARWPDVFWNIDVKTDDAVEPTVDLLSELTSPDRVCVAAFDRSRLDRLRRALGSGWCSAMARNEIVVARIAAWMRLPVPRFGDVIQAPESHKGITVVDERFVDACHRRDIAVHVWTVNDEDEMRRLGALGVDALITDNPARALSLIERKT